MVATEMKQEWMPIDVRHFVFGVVFIDFASTYLAIRANPAVASFHIRVDHYGQPAVR
jgi:hypothetical protein